MEAHTAWCVSHHLPRRSSILFFPGKYNEESTEELLNTQFKDYFPLLNFKKVHILPRKKKKVHLNLLKQNPCYFSTCHWILLKEKEESWTIFTGLLQHVHSLNRDEVPKEKFMWLFISPFFFQRPSRPTTRQGMTGLWAALPVKHVNWVG